MKTNIFTPNQNRIQTLENLTNKLKKKKKNEGWKLIFLHQILIESKLF